MIVGGSTGSFVAGAAADYLGWTATFLLLTVLFVAALALVVANGVRR